MVQPTRIIDIHQHVCWHGRDEDDLVADLDEQGIERAVLQTWEVTPLEAGALNYRGAFNPVHARAGQRHPGMVLADVVRAVRKYPERFVAAYCPHPLDGGAIDDLSAAMRMHGVRLCGEWKASVHLDDPRCLNLFRFCGDNGLAVLFHVDVPYRPDAETGEPAYCTEWYAGTPDDVARAVAACPQTNFIAHGPGFWRHISGDADAAAGTYPEGAVTPGGRVEGLLREHSNLCADLSAGSGRRAIARDPDYSRRLLTEFRDRIVFGRDGYGGELMEVLRSIDLPQEVMDDICFRNAERLLGLNAPQRG